MWWPVFTVSWNQEDPERGLERMGSFLGRQPRAASLVSAFAGRGRLHGSSGFHCAKAQCLCLNSYVCVAGGAYCVC